MTLKLAQFVMTQKISTKSSYPKNILIFLKTLKLAQFVMTQKISTKYSYPKKILIFLKTQKNIEIQNFEPKK